MFNLWEAQCRSICLIYGNPNNLKLSKLSFDANSKIFINYMKLLPLENVIPRVPVTIFFVIDRSSLIRSIRVLLSLFYSSNTEKQHNSSRFKWEIYRFRAWLVLLFECEAVELFEGERREMISHAPKQMAMLRNISKD